jgi:hypothetical protein
VAAADGQEGTAAVAAVKPAGRGRGGKFRGRGGQQATAAKTGTGGGAGTAGIPAADPTPSDLARMSSGLCFFHWAFANKASKCAALHMGKLGRQGRLNAVVPGSLVHIVDQLSNRRFLVDTGTTTPSFLTFLPLLLQAPS